MDSAALAALPVTFAPRAWVGGAKRRYVPFRWRKADLPSHVCLHERVYLVRDHPAARPPGPAQTATSWCCGDFVANFIIKSSLPFWYFQCHGCCEKGRVGSEKVGGQAEPGVRR